MKIIRGEDGDPLRHMLLIPLLHQWRIKHCNVEGCGGKPAAILKDMAEGVPPLGVCETHYREAEKAGKWSHKFEWGGVDA